MSHSDFGEKIYVSSFNHISGLTSMLETKRVGEKFEMLMTDLGSW